MKKCTLIFVLVWISMIAFSQTPQAFKYQTVARNSAGEILASQSISFRMAILQGVLPGTVVYAESHTATTNATGLVTLEIGRGTPVTGSFVAINWSVTPIFLKTEIDPAGGSAFVEMGTSELLSVPFSLYAKTAGNGFSGNYNDLSNKPALWDSTWLTIKNKPTTVAGYGITNAMTTAHPANGIISDNITNWNTAFSWGNHASVGYLTSFTETDPFWTAASSNYYTKTNMQTGGAAALHFNNLTNKPTTIAGYGITNAMTTSHAANGITSGNITNWNTAYTNRITAATGTAPLTLAISSNQLSGSIATANSTTSGYLTTADWNSFNNKVSSQWTANGLKLHYNTGNVGIGTTNPQSKVDIAGNAVIGFSYSGASAAPTNGLLVEGKVGIGTTVPASSALVELSSTSTGFLPPRMTTVQMNSIISPAEGLTIYNTTIKTLCWFDGTSWTYVPQDRKSCGTISYEGKTYETVVIGSQCWMKQNLNVGTMIDVSVGQTNNTIVEKYCYNNDEANCNVYGGFYQWDELMNWTSSSATNPSGRQGICPTGWHIPSDAEWCQVYTYLDPDFNCGNTSWVITDAGAKMRETGTSHWASSIGTNTSGFTALGTGFISGGTFYYLNVSAAIWSATEDSGTDAWYFYLFDSYTWISHDHSEKAMGNSARCVKD